MADSMVKFVKSRVEEVLENVDFRNKNVLEIGCVGIGKDDEIGGENWLLGRVEKRAKRVVGIDIDKRGVNKLRKMGYNVRFADAQKPFHLKEKFDIILAVKILEHIQDLKTFFTNVKKHLRKNGIFVVVTPNAHSISFSMQSLISGRPDISTKHTHWHDINTLKNLLEMNGFEIVKIDYSHPRPIFNRLRGYFVQTFWILFPKRFGRQIFCIARVRK